jgi:hypothetical protein
MSESDHTATAPAGYAAFAAAHRAFSRTEVYYGWELA